MTTKVPLSLLDSTGASSGMVPYYDGTKIIWKSGTTVAGITIPLPLTQGGTGATTLAGVYSALGLGSAATYNTGTSGGTIPLLNGANTWAGVQTFNGITPTYPIGIVGNKSGANVTAGSIGEFLSASGSGTNLPSGTTTNAASLGLTPGDWDVQAVVAFNPASGTVFTGPMCAGIGTGSATLASFQYQQIYPTNTATAGILLASPVVRINVAANTTIYAHALSGVTVSTATVSAQITARRR